METPCHNILLETNLLCPPHTMCSCTPGMAVFSAEHDPSQPCAHAWTTVHKGVRHVSCKLYPNVVGAYVNDWVHTILEVAECDPTGKCDWVDFFFSANIPTDIPGKHTTIWCNPDYHSYPWE